MSKQKITVKLRILESDYQLMCDPHERSLLIDAADNLNNMLYEMRRKDPLLPLERLVMMAAIRLAFELQQERETFSKEIQLLNDISTKLSSTLDEALGQETLSEG